MGRDKRSACQLLVEGRDDQFAVVELLTRHGLDFDEKNPRPPAYIVDCKGIDGLMKNIGTWVKTYPRLGVVVDADHPPFDRWAQIRGALERVGPASPEASELGGTIVPGHEDGWKIGIWVMPDNSAPGMLEDFLARLVPETDRCWPHAVEATARAIELEAPLKQLHATKGAMHAWLAWQDPSGQPFGTALRSHALRHDSPDALAFLRWFCRLFDVTRERP